MNKNFDQMLPQIPAYRAIFMDMADKAAAKGKEETAALFIALCEALVKTSVLLPKGVVDTTASTIAEMFDEARASWAQFNASDAAQSEH